MAISIISFIFGVIVFIIGVTLNPTSAPQQTVQYLTFVCSTIFIATGLICIKLNSNSTEVITELNNTLKNLEHKIESNKNN